MSPAQLPAKILKRMAQVRRLGARGLVRTAYVRALGPSVYSLTDPARSIAAGLHRRRALGRSLPLRIETLKQRTENLKEARGSRVEFGTDVARFIQSLEALLDLTEAGCPVPRTLGVDWCSNAIIVEQVGGPPGAEAVRDIERALLAIHRAGYVVGEVGSDALARTRSGAILIRDLRHATPLAGLSRDMSIHLRDEDSRRFNALFGTSLLTAHQLRALLSPRAGVPTNSINGLSEVYAPVVIRDDIRWGKIWNTDLGIGRWNFIMKEHLPIPMGGTVLDLGSNNGFNPLQMLRAGAASAVGIEIHKPAVEQSLFLKSVYEWLDNRSYDFRCIHGSQGDLPALNLPRFDVVTALCALYYLPDAQIRHLVRYLRTRTDTLVLQCNEDRLLDRGGDEETFRKASLAYALEVLEQAGFRNRQVIAPPGYSRPIVIARA